MKLLVIVAVVGCGGGGGDDALQAGECRTKSDCAQSFDFCGTYTLEPLCHGMAESDFSHPCQMDGECAQFGASSICDNRLCIEPRGGAQPILHCRPGCSVAADCSPGDTCTQHRCVTATCSQPAECGANNTCTSGSCAARSCAHDSECDDRCVNGSCAASIGGCQQAVP